MPKFKTTTYHKIREVKERIVVAQGSQGAGKNWAIEDILWEDIEGTDKIATILSDTYPNLKDGPIQDYKRMFHNNGMIFSDYYNAQEKELKLLGGTIQFRYVAGHKGDAGKSKRRNILYINEANKHTWTSCQHYISRTSEKVYIDLNPDYPCWVNTEIEPRDDSKTIIVTYLDNELCPRSEREYIESRRHKTEWFRVYGLGLMGKYSERQIYTYDTVQNVPESAQRITSGMDFGMSPDRTSLVDIYTEGNKIYVDEVFTENNLLPEKLEGAVRPSIVDRMDELEFQKNWPIGADSSGANEIADLRKHGYTVTGVKNKAGAQIKWTNKIRAHDIYVTEWSENVTKAMNTFLFKEDRNGNIIPEPQGHEPDPLAALRYGCMLGLVTNQNRRSSSLRGRR